MSDAVIIIIAADFFYREKQQPNYRTDIDIVVAVLRGNYLKAQKIKKTRDRTSFYSMLKCRTKNNISMDKINRKTLKWSVIH